MNLSELRVLKAVHECGGVTQAAAQLNCVQSNVTARLKQLEQRLGVELFSRRNRRMTLTPRGRVLLDYAERLLGLAAEAEHVMQTGSAMAGRVRIGSMETSAATRLPLLLQRFHATWPEIELQLLTGPSRETVARVRDYDLDVGIVAGPLDAPDLQSCPLWREELVLVTEAGHPPVVEPAQLRNRNLLVFRDGCDYRQRLEAWLERGGVPTGRVHVFGSFHAIAGCAAAGMGVALLPVSALALCEGLALGVHRLAPEDAWARTRLIWRAERAVLAPVRAFVDQLCEWGGERPDGAAEA
jgi:DNA-binding transcriptional LysR family regulator